MANQSAEQSILSVAREGNIEGLYSLIEKDPHVLEEIDNTTFAETPLHVAALAGQASFATELMMLKPSFARKLNRKGFSPLHLALQAHQEVDPANIDLRKRLKNVVFRLLEIDNNLICVKGKGGLTPLHYVAQTGDLELVIEFLTVCPKSILEVTSRNESPLHIALKHRQFPAFHLLREWLDLAELPEAFMSREQLLSLKDEKDKTISDIAKDEDLSQVSYNEIKPFLRHKSAIRKPHTERWREETRNALLVVVTLLVTLTFQTMLTPPGGLWSDDYRCPVNDASSCAEKPSHRAGTAIMGPGLFLMLAVFNASACFSLFFLVLSLLPTQIYHVGWVLSVCGLIVCFILSAFVAYPRPEGLSTKYLYPVVVVVLTMLFCYLSHRFSGPAWARALKRFRLYIHR